MKMLTTFVLLCAGMVLTNAAAVPEAEPDQMTGEASIQGGELLLNLPVPEAEPHEEVTGEALIQEDDGLSCAGGWARYGDRCYHYIATEQPWAHAEDFCRELAGNLVSIHSYDEENFVKGVIQSAANGSPTTWIGGSDAQQEGVWLWSDTSFFGFTNWCQGEPNNHRGQHCIQMNFNGGKCWDDLSCYENLPYVCVRKLRIFD